MPTNNHHTLRAATGKAREKKDLFTHTQTISESRQYEAGTHRIQFEFRFPRREEVQLSPSSYPFTVDNFFYFAYELTATATLFENNKKRVVNAMRLPTFVSSRDQTIEIVNFSVFDIALCPALSLGSRWFSITNSKSGSSSKFVQDKELHALLEVPRMITTKVSIPLIMNVQRYQVESGRRMQQEQKVRLLSFKIYLRTRIKLTAQGCTAEVDLSRNEPMRIASWTNRRSQDAIQLTLGEPFNVGHKLGLTCPRYIRATFRNELVQYEYVFEIRAEFNFCGRTYVVNYDDVPVDLQPHFVRDNGENRDYASSPPEEPPPLSDSPLSGCPFVSEPSDPPTPPPTFEEAMSCPLRGRNFSTDSSISAMSL